MDTKRLKRVSEYEWRIERAGKMRVDGVIFASEKLIRDMDEKVYEQITNVAALPGIVRASFAMPDAHWGYGFPIGGVAAFDPDASGVISAGGVGFDIACGVRTLHTGLKTGDIEGKRQEIAEGLFRKVPAGLGSRGKLHLNKKAMDEALAGGAKWAVEKGYGTAEDLRFIEYGGRIEGARPGEVSDHAKKRQEDEVGTLGSGNHYLEVQRVVEIYDKETAEAFGISVDDLKLSIHCGSRGLGHQIGTDFLKKMTTSAAQFGIQLPERELACAPLDSKLGQSYLGAMRSGINCALANRQVLTHLVRQVFDRIMPKATIKLLYDVSHNTCQEEEHDIDGKRRRVFIHRKGATRSFGPGHGFLPGEYRHVGQPVLIGGTMGTSSYILVGTSESEERAFGSACHGAGRNMSRTAAKKRWRGTEVAGQLAASGVLIRSKNLRGVAEEAPGAYKDVNAVVEATEKAHLARKVAKLVPLICVKG